MGDEKRWQNDGTDTIKGEDRPWGGIRECGIQRWKKSKVFLAT